MTPRAVSAALAGLVALVAATASFAVLSGRGDGVFGGVWVANEGSGSLAVLDASTNEVVATLTGLAAPHNVQAGRGDAVWATAGTGEVVMLETHYDLHWRGRVGGHPAHVIETPAGDVYATDEAAGVVVAFHGTRRARTAVPVGSSPHGLRATPDGKHVLVANRGSGTVSVIDTHRRRAVAEIPVGREPVQVAVAPDGRTAWVTLRGEDAVAAIDLRRRRVVAKAKVGRGPVQLAPTPDGRSLVVATQGTAARPARAVSVVSTAPLRETVRIPAGSGPHGVAVDPSGRRAYVTNVYSGTVSVLDLRRGVEVAEVWTGRAPNGITFSPREPAGLAHPRGLGRGGGHRH